MSDSTTRTAVVLLSGGLDSATVLAMARHDGFACHCISVRYGQRHSAELDAAVRIASELGAVEHRIVDVDLSAIGGSALTDTNIPVPGAYRGYGAPQALFALESHMEDIAIALNMDVMEFDRVIADQEYRDQVLEDKQRIKAAAIIFRLSNP